MSGGFRVVVRKVEAFRPVPRPLLRAAARASRAPSRQQRKAAARVRRLVARYGLQVRR